MFTYRAGYGYGYGIANTTKALKENKFVKMRYKKKIAPLVKQAFIDAGWDTDFVHRTFENLSDGMAGQYCPPGRFVSGWAYCTFEMMEDLSDMQTCLQTVGLRVDVVRYLMPLILPLQNNTYSNDQLLTEAILHLLKVGTYSRIQSQMNGFLYMPEVINTWYKPTGEYNDIYLNLIGPCNRNRGSELQTFLSRIPTQLSPGLKLFYHTTSWTSGTWMLNRSFTHSNNPCRSDFGVYPVMYLSDSIYDSVESGELHTGLYNGQICIVIFALPQSFPDIYTVYDVSGVEWSDLVEQCRYDEEEPIGFSRVDFVYGNVVANPNEVRFCRAKPVPHTPPKNQLACRSDNGQKLLRNSIVGCIFFQDQQTCA